MTSSTAWSPIEQESSPNTAWRRWRDVVWLGLILAGAMALRLMLARADRVVWGDEPFYLWLGRNWVEGKGFQFMGHADVHHGPLFPMLAGLLYLIVGDLTAASNTLYVVAGALLSLPIYAMGREIYDRRVGLIAAALTAVFPALTASVINWGTLTEPLYMLLVYLGLWLGLLMFRPLWRAATEDSPKAPWWAFGGTGLAFGLAYLTRPEAINYFLILGLFWAVLSLARGQWRRWRFWLHGVVYVLGFMLAFLPYAYYVQQVTGAWMVSEKIGVAYLTGIGLAHGDTAAFDRSTWGLDSTGLETFFFSSESHTVSMMQLILDDPRTFAIVLYLNAQTVARVLVDWTLFPLILLPLACIGLFWQAWGRERLLREAYLVLSTAPVLSFILFFIQARYLVAMVPVLILWTACGVTGLADWLGASWAALRRSGNPGAGRRWLLDLSITGLLVALLVGAHPMVIGKVRNVGSVRVEHRLLGERLAGLVARDDVIMARYPAIAYHAGVAWVPTPNASLPEVLAYARHKGVSLMVIDERELYLRPQFRLLMAEEATYPGLARIEGLAGDPSLAVFRLTD